jgi:hypothetical protein
MPLSGAYLAFVSVSTQSVQALFPAAALILPGAHCVQVEDDKAE